MTNSMEFWRALLHHGQEQSRCAVSELYKQAHEIQESHHTATQVSEKIERKKKKVIQYAVLEFIDSITVLYGQGLACSSCTFQSTRAAGKAKISPIKTLQRTCLRCNHHSRPSFLQIFSQKFWPPCNYFAQDSVLFFKKTKAGRFFKTVQKYFNGIVNGIIRLMTISMGQSEHGQQHLQDQKRMDVLPLDQHSRLRACRGEVCSSLPSKPSLLGS